MQINIGAKVNDHVNRNCMFFLGAMAEGARGEGGGDIPTIFNPHRIRAPPNVVVTNETSRGGVPNGPFGRSSHALQHSDSGC